MEVASKLIGDTTPRDAAGNPVNPLDAHLASLELSFIETIDAASAEWKALERYAKDTQGKTHGLSSELMCAFRVGRCVGPEAPWLS